MLKKFTKLHFGIILITLISLFLRLYKLETLPYNFHEDEVLSGYIGRFILQNGKDIYGNPWPIFYFNKFGDYYIIGPIYLSSLSTFIFGITQFATRFPAALLGGLLTIPIYLLSNELFKNKKIALLSSLFYAISPWSIVLSRTTSEGVIGSFFFTFGVYLLVKSLKTSSLKELTLANIFFLVGYDIYHPFRVYPLFILLITFILILIFKMKISKKFRFALIISFFIFAFTTFTIGQTKWGKGRFLQTSIFAKVSGVQLKIQDLIFTEKTKNFALIRFFHNKPWHYGREFLSQYSTYFSPSFLTFKSWGGLRYFVPEQGIIYLTFLLFFYLGFIKLVKIKNRFEKYFLILLLLLAPLPAAFTIVESPNPHRSFFILVPLSIITALGFKEILNTKFYKLQKLFLFIIITFLSFEFFYFIHQYFVHHDYFSSFYRNDGQKETAFLLQELQKKYDKVYISSSKAMSWYYLFYSKNFDKNLIGKFKLDSKIDKIKNIYFVENSCPSTDNAVIYNKDKNIAIIDRPECESNQNDFKIIKTFYGKNPLLKYKILIPK